MATQLDKAIAQVKQARGMSQAEKKAIIQQLKRDASKTGNLGAGDRQTMRDSIAAARANNNPGGGNSTAPGAPPPVTGGDDVLVTPPGEEVQETPGPDLTKPPGPAADGFYWTVDNGVWVQLPLQTTPSGPTGEQRQAAKEFLRDLLGRFGLDALAGDVDALIQQWGVNSDVIAIKLKETGTYKERFKGNLNRIKNGYNMLTEAEYLAAEDAIATRMRLRGMSPGFQSRDYIANLLANDVSAAEVDTRLEQAQRVVDNADPMVVDSLRRLYGASVGDLYGYVLDADTAIGDIEKKVSAGITARVAEQSGLTIGRGLAEQIGQMTGGNEQTLRPVLSRAGALADSTERLAAIEGIRDITDEDVLEGELGYNAESRDRVRKLQSKERARFSGQSGLGRSTLGGGSTY